MKNKILAIFFICAVARIGFCENTLKIEVNEIPPIFPQEVFYATARITNLSTQPVTLMESFYCPTSDHWISDNPAIHTFGGVCIDHSKDVNDRREKIALAPGQVQESKIQLYAPPNSSLGESMTFKLGLKEYPDSVPVWSEPIKVLFKNEKVLPVKIEVKAPIMEVRSWEPTKVSLSISNTSDTPQNIGTEVCGAHGVDNNFITDNKLVSVQGVGCMRNIYPPKDIILMPNEVYEQTLTILFDKINVESGPFTFRLGLKNVGRTPAWSTDIVLNMQAGTAEEKAKWTKSANYQKEFVKQNDVSSQKDGIIKRYYETGELYDERTVKDGKLDGQTKYYYTNGKLMKEVTYVKGDPTHWVDYNEGGSVQFDSTPLDGAMRSH